jgi:hypothetical protein
MYEVLLIQKVLRGKLSEMKAGFMIKGGPLTRAYTVSRCYAYRYWDLERRDT